jgi:hypothetical protein
MLTPHRLLLLVCLVDAILVAAVVTITEFNEEKLTERGKDATLLHIARWRW